MPQRRSAPTRRVATKQPTSLSLPGGHELLLTRRHFLYGVAGVAALAAVGGGAEGVKLLTEQLHSQLVSGMVLTGCGSVREAGRHLVNMAKPF